MAPKQSIFKNLLPGAVIAEAEQQALLGKESSPRQRTDLALHRASTIVSCFAYFTCFLLCLAGVITLALFYNRVDRALATIDGSVPLTQTAATMLKNVNSALNFTAEVTKQTSIMMSKAHPTLISTLNSTHATIQHVERLTQNPTISMG